MNKQLGIGVRVRVGWVPTEDMTLRSHSDPRFRTATIINGPLAPGVYKNELGELERLKSVYWGVALDGGGEISADERLLTPIDDDDDPNTFMEPTEQALETIS